MINNYIPATYTLDFKNFNDFTDIMRFCRKNKIEIYVYYFMWKNYVLKYGIQHRFGGTGNDYGERVYTQSGHMPGWSKLGLKRCPTTKAEIDKIIDKVEKTFNVKFDKNDVQLTIMDYTKAPFEIAWDPRAELQRVEDDFIINHQNIHGHAPIGNTAIISNKKTPLLITTGLFEIF